MADSPTLTGNCYDAWTYHSLLPGWRATVPMEMIPPGAGSRQLRALTAGEHADRLRRALQAYQRAQTPVHRAQSAGALALTLVTTGPLYVAELSASVLLALRESPIPWLLTDVAADEHVLDAAPSMLPLAGFREAHNPRQLLGRSVFTFCTDEWNAYFTRHVWRQQQAGQTRLGAYRDLRRTGHAIISGATPVVHRGATLCLQYQFKVLLPVYHTGPVLTPRLRALGGAPAGVRPLCPLEAPA